MVTNEQITDYRSRTSRLLLALRNCIFLESGRTRFPTDASISYLLGLSPTAFSSISRQCSSMSGIILLKLMQELSKHLDDESFLVTFRNFVDF